MMKLKSKYALVLLLAWLMALPMMGQVEKDVTDDDDDSVAAGGTPGPRGSLQWILMVRVAASRPFFERKAVPPWT